jgi:hypothetical protein
LSEDVYKVIEVMSDRITDLAKSYRVLNDSHTRLELEFVELRAQVGTSIAIVKWFLSPISFVLLVIKLAELANWIG